MFLRSGTIVCVWEPHWVWTLLMRTGTAGFVRSKMRIPSKQNGGPQAVVSDERTSLQKSLPSVFRWGWSIPMKSRSLPLCSQSPTSFCGPRQSLLVISCFV